jgi:integrase
MLIIAVDTYLTARRAVGFKLKDHEGILRNFAAFATAKGDTYVRKGTVLEWIRGAECSPLRNVVRLRTVVRLARYLHAEDERHEIPSEDACGRHRAQRKPPFLFSPSDVKALVREATLLGPPNSFRPCVYSALFGLLAATGLRISEALNLRIKDVTSEGIVVRDTKFSKSRLLPLHASTQLRLNEYLVHRAKITCQCPWFFISGRGRKLHASTVRGVFRGLLYRLGIARPQDKRQPRLHDLRFYFANQALTIPAVDTAGISRHMLALTTYLGHADARNGYWYLEATPALFAKIAESCEAFLNGGNL